LNEKLRRTQKQLLGLYNSIHHFRIETTSSNTTIFLQQVPLRNDNPVQEKLTATANVIYENI
jgi:hypothetical protein